MFQNLEIRIHFYFHSARGRYRRCQHLTAFFQLEQEQLHHSMSGKPFHKVLAFYGFLYFRQNNRISDAIEKKQNPLLDM